MGKLKLRKKIPTTTNDLSDTYRGRIHLNLAMEPTNYESLSVVYRGRLMIDGTDLPLINNKMRMSISQASKLRINNGI